MDNTLESDGTKLVEVRHGRYVGKHYPDWKHNGQPCRVIAEKGDGVYIKFNGDDTPLDDTSLVGAYFVHKKDVVDD